MHVKELITMEAMEGIQPFGNRNYEIRALHDIQRKHINKRTSVLIAL